MEASILEILNTIIAATIPIIIAIFGFRMERRKILEREAKQKAQDDLESKHEKRIQFEVDATIFGPQKGIYIADIALILDNRGLVKNEINELQLKVLGILKGTEVETFERKVYTEPKDDKKNLDAIVHFADEIVNTNILKTKNKEDGFFVEPGIRQRFSYVAMIPETTSYILVRASFKYHSNSKHTAQKVFRVNGICIEESE